MLSDRPYIADDRTEELLPDKIARLEAEVLEQCRINGMGAERELSLMAKVERLERELIAVPRSRLRIEEKELFQKQIEQLEGSYKALLATHDEAIKHACRLERENAELRKQLSELALQKITDFSQENGL